MWKVRNLVVLSHVYSGTGESESALYQITPLIPPLHPHEGQSKRAPSFFFKQKTAYEITEGDWSSDVCSSDLIPGWDCHGLPIELQVEKKHGRPGHKLDAQAFRAACRAYAHEQIHLQRADFKRLGVLRDWDRPYLTMSPGYEAQQLRAFGRIIRNGHLYKGVKPVHWCLDCRSALAEAEVEYEEKTEERRVGKECPQLCRSRWSP